MNENDKIVGPAEKPEKPEILENSNAVANEFGKPQIDQPVEENQKLGKSENVTDENIAQTIEQANEKKWY